MKHFDRATKIVATIGPASRDPAVLEAMIDAGLNVVRMNFSHGSQDDHRQTYAMVRELAARKGVTIGILQDLQGPKIRVGRFASGSATLQRGQTFIITMDEVEGDETRVGSTYKGLAADVHPGMALLLDDGNMALRVEGVRGNDVHTVVVVGGVLKNNKGINVPEADLSVPALSDKDVQDMAFGAELGVDWVALSFVRSRDDLLLARHYLARYGSRAKLMAKIEKPQAVERFEDILREVDGIMVARGDLGVEMRAEQVPVIQKRLIRACREVGKPVITATQMLESMVTLPRPTRAEASDVANAIFDGTDAVMLSGETAIGLYPVEAVATMSRIVAEAEAFDPGTFPSAVARRANELLTAQARTVRVLPITEGVVEAASLVCRRLNAALLIVITHSGRTALALSKRRHPTPTLALCPAPEVARALSLYWGVTPIHVPDVEADGEHALAFAQDWARARHLVAPGDRIVLVRGTLPGNPVHNAILVQEVGG